MARTKRTLLIKSSGPSTLTGKQSSFLDKLWRNQDERIRFETECKVGHLPLNTADVPREVWLPYHKAFTAWGLKQLENTSLGSAPPVV